MNMSTAAFDEPLPAGAAGIVGELLAGQAADERSPEIHGVGIGDAVRGEEGLHPGEHLDGRRVRLGRGFEARDRPLEQQLVARRVARRELEHANGARVQQRLASVGDLVSAVTSSSAWRQPWANIAS